MPLLKSQKALVCEKGIERAQHFDIRIQIDAALLIQGVEPHEICDLGPQLLLPNALQVW